MGWCVINTSLLEVYRVVGMIVGKWKYNVGCGRTSHILCQLPKFGGDHYIIVCFVLEND